MKKKFIVIGNPIKHSLSPELHNHWIKQNDINADYEKILLKENELEKLILDLREGKIHGINVTVPFKKVIIAFLDELTDEAEISQSVNTIHKDKNKIIGSNTDISGFQAGLKNTNQTIRDKKALILGAGGVVSSVVVALQKMEISQIYLSNRTLSKAKDLKKIFPKIEIIKWGDIVDFDIIINATSVGLNEDEIIDLDYKRISKNKFFYDIIYNPSETNFLKKSKEFGAQTENGKMMFIHQAQKAFFIWHKILPKIDSDTIRLLDI